MGRVIADDEPGRTRQAIIKNLCHHGDIGVDIRSDNLAGVDIYNPELAEGRV